MIICVYVCTRICYMYTLRKVGLHDFGCQEYKANMLILLSNSTNPPERCLIKCDSFRQSLGV